MSAAERTVASSQSSSSLLGLFLVDLLLGGDAPPLTSPFQCRSTTVGCRRRQRGPLHSAGVDERSPSFWTADAVTVPSNVADGTVSSQRQLPGSTDDAFCRSAC